MVDLKASGDMPPNEASFIETAYLPEFLDYATADMFNEKVGEVLQSAGTEISALSLSYLFSQRYPHYVTLMGTQNWASSLSKYLVALRQLDSALHRRGDENVVGEKTEIAGKFTLSNTGFDNFVATFGSLIKIVRDFSGKRPGEIRFTLHPLESLIIEWLRGSDQTVQTGKHTARRIGRSQVLRWAIDYGYQTDEIEKALELLEAREMVVLTTDWVVEAISELLNLESMKSDLNLHREEVNALAVSFPTETVRTFQTRVSQIAEALDTQLRAKIADPVQLSKISNSLKQSRTTVAAFAKDKRSDLATRLAKVGVTALRDNELILLQQPMDDEIDYVDQVNALRVWLLDVINKTQLRVIDHQSEVQRARDLLRPDVAITQLPQISTMLKSLEDAQSKLQGNVTEARDRFKDYERWRALVKEGATVITVLHNLRLEGTETAREQMKNLILDIRAEISSRKLDALTAHQQFTVQLEEVKRQLEGLQRNARTAFDSERDRLVRRLREMEAQIDPALFTLAFNPGDPTNAYTLLYNLVSSQFTNAFDELQKYINARQQTTQVLHRQASHLPSRETTTLQNQAREIEALLNQLQEQRLIFMLNCRYQSHPPR